jgi:hypothetical protein
LGIVEFDWAERMGTMTTLVTVIGGEEVVAGFDRKKLERLLEP